jgi:acid phosphatase (class A)
MIEPFSNRLGNLHMINPSARSVAVGLALMALLVCAGGRLAADETTVPPEMAGDQIKGYLAKPLDSAALLPRPPADGSAAQALDVEIDFADFALAGTDRWKLAAVDADLTFPHAAGAFSCALNAPVTPQDAPRLYRMLQRVMADAGASTRTAKDRYRRPRPFMLNHAPTCFPAADNALRSSGSYPSGHSAIGWAWAFALAEASPDQSEAILARGRAFGESRLVCNVHWDSDVVEGRFLGAATVARLHAEPEFVADLAAAKSELAAARAKGLPPQSDCKFEAAALAETPPQGP